MFKENTYNFFFNLTTTKCFKISSDERQPQIQGLKSRKKKKNL